MLHSSLDRRRASAPSTIWPTSCSPPPTASPKPAGPRQPDSVFTLVRGHALASLTVRDSEYGADKIRHCLMALFVLSPASTSFRSLLFSRHRSQSRAGPGVLATGQHATPRCPNPPSRPAQRRSSCAASDGVAALGRLVPSHGQPRRPGLRGPGLCAWSPGGRQCGLGPACTEPLSLRRSASL